MKSKVLKKDHKHLVEINRALSPEERLMAFYRHSHLLGLLAAAGAKKRSAKKRKA